MLFQTKSKLSIQNFQFQSLVSFHCITSLEKPWVCCFMLRFTFSVDWNSAVILCCCWCCDVFCLVRALFCLSGLSYAFICNPTQSFWFYCTPFLNALHFVLMLQSHEVLMHTCPNTHNNTTYLQRYCDWALRHYKHKTCYLFQHKALSVSQIRCFIHLALSD